MVHWCLEVVPVMYASITRSSRIARTSSRRFRFSTLMVWNRCDRYRILKENSWICILHQYHKASRLKSYTMMCRKWGKWGKYIHHSIKMAALTFFSGRGWGSCCHERIWNNYVEIHWKNMQVMFIISWSTWGYNSLDDPTRQHDNLKENKSGRRRIVW